MNERRPLPGATSDLGIDAGTPAFRRVTLALTAAGFSTFAVLYCVQPLLPVFTAEFHVSPAESSLALSSSTGLLALGLLLAGPLSDLWGRKQVMVGSLFASADLTLAAAVAPNWPALLLLRAMAGLALSGRHRWRTRCAPRSAAGPGNMNVLRFGNPGTPAGAGTTVYLALSVLTAGAGCTARLAEAA